MILHAKNHQEFSGNHTSPSTQNKGFDTGIAIISMGEVLDKEFKKLFGGISMSLKNTKNISIF
jgi:hypothetical protein